MSITIHRVSLMPDSFAKPLRWDDVIGLNVNGTPTTSFINIEVEASSTAFATLPADVKVSVSSRLPNRQAGPSTLFKPLTFSVPRWGSNPAAPPFSSASPLAKFDQYPRGPAPTTPGRVLYRLSRAVAQLGNFGGTNCVATVVRTGGTSDKNFRQPFGSSLRGAAMQPVNNPGQSTGNESQEVPDGLRLMWSGGLEVLEASIVPDSGWNVQQSSSKRLIRSPATVFYYSGHGLTSVGVRGGARNCLGIEDSSHLIGNYSCWEEPADLVQYWRNLPNLDLFIIAGCSVLNLDLTNLVTSPSRVLSGRTGVEWAKLLSTKGGPLTAILGYANEGPSDHPVGESIATDMANLLAGGSTSYVQDWLNVNMKYSAWSAVGMDGSGYWTINASAAGRISRRVGLTSSAPTAKIVGPASIP
jgi:hypothetical protein